MPYNLRPRNTTAVKRPAEAALSSRKRQRGGSKSGQVLYSDVGNALRKKVLRPLGLFESLFAAYPVTQSIIQHLSTPDVISLCITTPHLWRLLAENHSFHVFSNHRNGLDLARPVRNLKEYYSRNVYEKFFSGIGDLERLFSNYVDYAAITHLVLDRTDLEYRVLLAITTKTKLKLLSLKHCRKLVLEGIEALLDPSSRFRGLLDAYPPESTRLQDGPPKALLSDLETLCIWGLPKTHWVYISSSYPEDNHLDDTITFTNILRFCRKKNIDLDVSRCLSPVPCTGFQGAMERWALNSHSSFFNDQPISDESIWMCEKKKLQCACGEIKDLSICEECIGDWYMEMYGFCQTCEQFICDSEICEGVWPLCDECGPQCWDCSFAKWHDTCTSCGDDICMPHATSKRVKQSCNICEARYCDNCYFRYDYCIIEKCCVCKENICADCLLTDPVCERCAMGVCKSCRKSIDEACPEKAFTPNAREVFSQYDRESSPSMDWCDGKWLCGGCLSSIKSRLSLRRSVRSGDYERERSFVWIDKQWSSF